MTPASRALLALPLAALAACRSAASQHESAERWTCAMHPQYVSDRPGDCPICGMKLVPRHGGDAPPGTAPPAPSRPRTPLYYRSPMDPRQTSPVPRSDEMGMAYVPVYADEVAPASGAAGHAVVTLAPERQRLLGIKTLEVTRAPLAARLRTTGRVAWDERRVARVSARFDGWIETLHANFTGQQVRKGEALASIYSPDLYATEQEYLLARQSASALAASGLPDAARAARDRLRLFGISDGEITRLEERGQAERALTLYAPLSGVVTVKNAVAGAKVSPDVPLFEIADASRVWVLADVYEQELPRLRLGQRATVTLAYWPGRSWSGRVTYVFPTVDEKARTVTVRVELDNPRLELKPQMFADVVIETAAREGLVVAEDAVMVTGTRKLVFVVAGDARFEPREIETGTHADGRYEVTRGLNPGERVAAGANFLVDAESQLRAAVAAMAPPATASPPASSRTANDRTASSRIGQEPAASGRMVPNNNKRRDGGTP